MKYPKTWHFPWSDSMSSDDHWHGDANHFVGCEVVMSEKLDGESTTMYQDFIHARSIDSQSHPSQSNARRLWGQIRHDIPQGWRVVCENLEALHSIYYVDLEHYLYVIGIYDERNVCLSWDETKMYAELLNLPTVPELYRGPWNEHTVRMRWRGDSVFKTFTEASARRMWGLHKECPLPMESFDMQHGLTALEATSGEGYVVRVADEFPYDKFDVSLSKYVRSGHVQTSKFWKTEEIIPNGRRTGGE